MQGNITIDTILAITKGTENQLRTQSVSSFNLVCLYIFKEVQSLYIKNRRNIIVYYQQFHVQLIIIKQMKIILVALLVILALSQTVVVGSVTVPINTYSTPTAPPTPPPSLQYTSLPLDQLDGVYSFLLQQIRSFYPYLNDFELAQANQRTSPDGLKKQIVFVYNLYGKNSTATQIRDETIIMGLGTDNMTYFVLFDGQSISYANYTEYLNRLENSPIVGGKTPADISKLSADQIDVQNYLLENVAKLQKWKLISLRTQIVAGQNYCFAYLDVQTNKTEEYCIWSQPWNNNFLQISLPDGSKINNQPAETNPTSTSTTQNTTTDNSNPVLASNETANSPISGGLVSSDVKNLTPQTNQIRSSIIQNVPKLSTWELVSLESQVVAGMRYCFTFKDPQSANSEEYCVWNQPWSNISELTLPDGSKLDISPRPSIVVQAPATVVQSVETIVPPNLNK